MGLFDQLHQLEQLHERGTLSREELERAKRELLESDPPGVADHVTLTVEQTSDEAELARIDREWEIESRRYQITTQRGQTYVPTKWGSWAHMLAGVTFGVCWTIIGIVKAGETAIFPLLGLLIIAFSTSLGLYLLTNAQRYQQAEAAYQQKRAAAIQRSWQK